MKALIIDDERKARNVLRILLEENCKEISEILEAEDLLSGVEQIKKEQPKLVFLDIEMPEHSGLEIVDFIDRSLYSFEIIFVTAYNEYAIQAFELSAVDYLLKPTRPSKVIEAVGKALKEIDKNQLAVKLDELKNSFGKKQFKKIALPFLDGIKFVNFEDIILLEADGMYTKITTNTTSEILVSKPLKHFVTLLSNQAMFYKPHRSYLINLSYIKEYIKKEGGYIVMDNNRTVSISKDRKEEFLEIVSCL
ncbi:LytTR family DNA-binding domain-containing protein [uncultured Tenacibaculum sp.]|uniref:LytR/AlgR family response regulator transcription factor n=1 Tax=uncultured Tenacibaculum sp. TaxID=174713 RepID=UPI00262972E4|nr:LytTR family DNA-binding domain-containing protein [uncultured Tenacibaculum sp.]